VETLSPGQTIATLLAQYLQAPAKPSQHFNAKLLAQYLQTPAKPSQHLNAKLLAQYLQAPAKPSQHFNATLLAQYLQAPAKPSQHFNATYRNIVGPVFASPGQTIATYQHNISQRCWAQHVGCVWPPCCDVLRHVGY